MWLSCMCTKERVTRPGEATAATSPIAPAAPSSSIQGHCTLALPRKAGIWMQRTTCGTVRNGPCVQALLNRQAQQRTFTLQYLSPYTVIAQNKEQAKSQICFEHLLNCCCWVECRWHVTAALLAAPRS